MLRTSMLPFLNRDRFSVRLLAKPQWYYSELVFIHDSLSRVSEQVSKPAARGLRAKHFITKYQCLWKDTGVILNIAKHDNFYRANKARTQCHASTPISIRPLHENEKIPVSSLPFISSSHHGSLQQNLLPLLQLLHKSDRDLERLRDNIGGCQGQPLRQGDVHDPIGLVNLDPDQIIRLGRILDVMSVPKRE
jgi:hypothetical protein